MLDLIKSVSRALIQLPLDHPVWLSAECQIKYHGIMESAKISTTKFLKDADLKNADGPKKIGPGGLSRKR
jgi:hypothetical protein